MERYLPTYLPTYIPYHHFASFILRPRHSQLPIRYFSFFRLLLACLASNLSSSFSGPHHPQNPFMARMSIIRQLHTINVSTLRNSPLTEISGSLGDLGTLLPLMIALAVNNSISLSTTLVFSGLWNILTGVTFGSMTLSTLDFIPTCGQRCKFTSSEGRYVLKWRHDQELHLRDLSSIQY
jgi:hypothetical protein